MRSLPLLALVILAGCSGGTPPNTTCGACDTPPANTCVSDSVLKRFASSGTCVAGTCEYVDTYEACAQGCGEGQCRGGGAGGGSGSAGGGSAGGGSSSGGGSAGGGSSGCGGLTCNQPPASVCENATTLRTFTSPGTCSDSLCQYGTQLVPCANGCSANACVGEPCQGVTCNSPPAATCLNATTRRGYAASGTCAQGQCSYAPQDTTCMFGCQNGVCQGDPCAGVACQQAPAAFCLDASTRRGWTTPGTCAGGSCTYAPIDTVCQFGCTAGACAGNPCQGVSCNQPPAPTCRDASTRRTFASSGTCAGGSCSYSPIDTTCPFGCTAGACQADPCQGVSCGAPPPNTCVDPNTARTYASGGTCQAGACAYAYADVACPSGCTAGSCNAPSCGGSTCNTPPVATCASATTKRIWSKVGSCGDAGTCAYQPRDVWCSEGCFQGDCLPGSWTQERLDDLFGTGSDPWYDLSYGVDPAGQHHVAWVGYRGNQPNVPAGYHVNYAFTSARGWAVETLDPGLGQSSQVSLAFGAQGQAMVAYYDGTNKDLRFAERVGQGFTKQLVATTGITGQSPALAVDAQGTPWVSFMDFDAKQLRLARRAQGGWSTELVHQYPGSSFSYGRSQLAVTPSGVVFVTREDDSSGWVLMRRSTTGAWSTVMGDVGRVSGVVAEGEHPAVAYLANLSSQESRVWRGLDGSSQTVHSAPNGSEPLQGPVRSRGSLMVTSSIGVVTSGGTTVPTLGLFTQVGDGWVNAQPKLQLGSPASALTVGPDGRVRWFTASGSYLRFVSEAPACTPSCGGKQCGADGCGGSCGTCATGVCGPTGQCGAWSTETVHGPTGYGDLSSLRGGLTADVALLTRGAELHAVVAASNVHVWKANGQWQGRVLSGVSIPSGRDHSVLRPDGGLLVLSTTGETATYAVAIEADGGLSPRGVMDGGIASNLSNYSASSWLALEPSGVMHHAALQRPFTPTGLSTSRTSGATQERQSFLLAPNSSTSAQSLVGTLDSSGVAHLLVKQLSYNSQTGVRTHFARSLSNGGGTWAFDTAPDAGVAGELQLFRGATGAPVACLPTATGVALAFKSGGTWSAPEPIPTTGSLAHDVLCRVSPLGVYEVIRRNGTTLEVLTRSGPGSWSTAVVPLAGQVRALADARYDSAGQLHILYFEANVGGNPSTFLRHAVR